MSYGLSIQQLNALATKLNADEPCGTCGRRYVVICPECKATWCMKCDGDKCREC